MDERTADRIARTPEQVELDDPVGQRPNGTTNVENYTCSDSLSHDIGGAAPTKLS